MYKFKISSRQRAVYSKVCITKFKSRSGIDMRKLQISIILFLLFTYAGAQEKGKLVVLSPKVGEEIDRGERDQYGLFPDVDNFISARIYLMRDHNYRAEVRYFSNSEVKTQVQYISNELFVRQFLSKFRRQRIKTRRRNPAADNREIRIRLKDDSQLTGRIDSVKNNNLYLRGDSSGSEQIIPVADINEFSEIRKITLLTGFGLSAIPGLVAGPLTYLMAEEDEGITLSAGRKGARFTFIAGEIIGLSIGGTISVLRGIDADYPLDGKTVDEKSEAISNFQRFHVRTKTNIRFGPWFGIYYAPSNLDDAAYLPGVRMSVAFSPRKRMEINYGYTTMFGKEHKRDYYSWAGDKYETTNLHFHLIRAGFRTDFSYRQNINPFVAWGWGMAQAFYENKNEGDDDIDLFINMDVGLEHHFTNYLSMETRVGIFENFDNGLEYMFQIGLHIGKYY